MFFFFKPRVLHPISQHIVVLKEHSTNSSYYRLPRHRNNSIFVAKELHQANYNGNIQIWSKERENGVHLFAPVHYDFGAHKPNRSSYFAHSLSSLIIIMTLSPR